MSRKRKVSIETRQLNRLPMSAFSCSFCGKDGSAANQLIVGPNAYICDSCVDISHAIISESRTARMCNTLGDGI